MKKKWHNRETLERKISRAVEFGEDETECLSIEYEEDPGDVRCPNCGPETVEIVGFIDTYFFLNRNQFLYISPDASYSVIVYCHRCKHWGVLYRDN